MSTIINMGSGGGGASIRAIAAANEQALPASADNTLAVISNVYPSEVYAQNTEPDSPKNGAVWVRVSGASSAEIHVGNITVYPTVAYQYVNGAWKSVTMFVRSGGEWIALEIWLFKTGNSFESITGGWKTYGRQSGIWVNDVENMEIGKNIVITMPTTPDGSSQYRSVAVGTVSMIPAGKFKKLVVKIGQTYVSDVDVGFARTVNNGYSPVYDKSISANGSEKTYEMDISSLGEDYEGYLFISARTVINALKTDTITVTEVYLCN